MDGVGVVSHMVKMPLLLFVYNLLGSGYKCRPFVSSLPDCIRPMVEVVWRSWIELGFPFIFMVGEARAIWEEKGAEVLWRHDVLSCVFGSVAGEKEKDFLFTTLGATRWRKCLVDFVVCTESRTLGCCLGLLFKQIWGSHSLKGRAAFVLI